MPCPNHALPSPPWLHSRSRKGLPSHLSPSGRACASGAPASTRSRHSDRRMMDLTVAHRSSIPDRKSREHHVKLKARDRVDVYRYAICWHWQHGHFGAMICTVYEEWREVRGAVGLGAAVTKSDKHDRGDPPERSGPISWRSIPGTATGRQRRRSTSGFSVRIGATTPGQSGPISWRSTPGTPTRPRRRRSTSGCSVTVWRTMPGRSVSSTGDRLRSCRHGPEGGGQPRGAP